MSSISKTYTNAILADATYALGVAGQPYASGATGSTLAGFLAERMTPTLANYLGDNFMVVSHIETDDTFASGFDAKGLGRHMGSAQARSHEGAAWAV